MALFGSEAHSVELRLSAIHHAVCHYDHYVEMVCTTACNCHAVRTGGNVTLFYTQYTTQLQDSGEVHQFMSSVMSSDEQFNERPQSDPTVNELVHYMLQVEIFGMSKLGSYSGKHLIDMAIRRYYTSVIDTTL